MSAAAAEVCCADAPFCLGPRVSSLTRTSIAVRAAPCLSCHSRVESSPATTTKEPFESIGASVAARLPQMDQAIQVVVFLSPTPALTGRRNESSSVPPTFLSSGSAPSRRDLGELGAVVLHLDERHPHLHHLVPIRERQDRPGVADLSFWRVAAGEQRVREEARAEGRPHLGRDIMAATRAERKALAQDYQAVVGARFGHTLTSDEPRKRRKRRDHLAIEKERQRADQAEAELRAMRQRLDAAEAEVATLRERVAALTVQPRPIVRVRVRPALASQLRLDDTRSARLVRRDQAGEPGGALDASPQGRVVAFDLGLGALPGFGEECVIGLDGRARGSRDRHGLRRRRQGARVWSAPEAGSAVPKGVPEVAFEGALLAR